MSTETVTNNDSVITANTEQILTNQRLIYEAGEKAEYDKFWDAFQQSGKRTNYAYGFYNWADSAFYPKYDIKPQGMMSNIFYSSAISGDLEERLNSCGVTFDTSLVTNMSSPFQNSSLLTIIPTLDVTSMGTSTLTNTFFNCRLLKKASFVNLQSTTKFSNTFYYCISLEDLTIDGTIGQDGFDVSSCINLTVESLYSILTALSKDSALASGKSVTFASVHQAVIEGDAECLEQLNLAINAGWTIAYA